MKHFYMVRKCLAVAAAALISVSCSRKQEPAGSKTRITATFYPIYIMLMNICDGAQDVELSMLAPADTGCLHDYQLTTRDMAVIEDCTILVANGAGMEDFLEKAIRLKKDRTVVASEENYTTVENNPHIWVSPAGAARQVRHIASALAELDEKNAGLYLKNGEEYAGQIEKLSERMHLQLDPYKGARIITFHEAFPYFASEFSLEIAGVIEREPGTTASSKELARMIDSIRDIQSQNGKIWLFAEPQYSSLEADIISKETGLTVNILDPCVTGELKKDSYLVSMENNLKSLLKAFGN